MLVASMWRLMYGSWTTGSFGVTSVWLRSETGGAERRPSSDQARAAARARARAASGAGASPSLPAAERLRARRQQHDTSRRRANASTASASTVIAFLVEKKPVDVEHLRAVRDRGLVVVLRQQAVAAQPVGDREQRRAASRAASERERRGEPAEEAARPADVLRPLAPAGGGQRADHRRDQQDLRRPGSRCRAWSRSPGRSKT